jgi:apolipoprotein N-acyltransferase
VPDRPIPRWIALVFAVVGGFVTDLGFPDTGVWLLAMVGVGMLYVAVTRDTPWWNALLGFAWSLTFFLRHIQWAQYSVGDSPWIALSVAESLFVAAVMLCWTWVLRVPLIAGRRPLQVVGFSVLWIGGELARSAWPFGGFPWGRLAFSQSDSPLGRLAWLGGAPLVSFVVAAIGVLLAMAVMTVIRLNMYGASACVVASAVLIGVGLAIPLDTQAESGALRVGAVQGNVSTPGLGAFANRREVLNNHVSGTYALLDQVDSGYLDLVLWPENGTDYDPQIDAAAATAIDDAAQAVGAPMLVGAQEYPASGGRYNVSLLWVPGIGVVDSYAKQHPAPFAEYIPLRSLVRTFSSAVDLVNTDMLPGTEVGVVDFESARLGRTVKIGNAICFEVAYDGIVNEAVFAGAEFLVIPTNNANFGPTAESAQQLAMSRLRAIETGRTTIQISTVGVSAVIAPNGVLLSETGLFTAEQMIETIDLRTSMTPAVLTAPWTPWITLGGVLVPLAAAFRTGLRQRPERKAARAERREGRRALSQAKGSRGSGTEVTRGTGSKPATASPKTKRSP